MKHGDACLKGDVTVEFDGHFYELSLEIRGEGDSDAEENLVRAMQTLAIERGRERIQWHIYPCADDEMTLYVIPTEGGLLKYSWTVSGFDTVTMTADILPPIAARIFNLYAFHIYVEGCARFGDEFEGRMALTRESSWSVFPRGHRFEGMYQEEYIDLENQRIDFFVYDPSMIQALKRGSFVRAVNSAMVRARVLDCHLQIKMPRVPARAFPDPRTNDGNLRRFCEKLHNLTFLEQLERDMRSAPEHLAASA